jgi:hypothetical protein
VWTHSWLLAWSGPPEDLDESEEAGDDQREPTAVWDLGRRISAYTRGGGSVYASRLIMVSLSPLPTLLRQDSLSPLPTLFRQDENRHPSMAPKTRRKNIDTMGFIYTWVNKGVKKPWGFIDKSSCKQWSADWGRDKTLPPWVLPN